MPHSVTAVLTSVVCEEMSQAAARRRLRRPSSAQHERRKHNRFLPRAFVLSGVHAEAAPQRGGCARSLNSLRYLVLRATFRELFLLA